MAFHVEDISLKYAAISPALLRDVPGPCNIPTFPDKESHPVGIEKITRRLSWNFGRSPIKLKFRALAFVVTNAADEDDDVELLGGGVGRVTWSALYSQIFRLPVEIKCNFRPGKFMHPQILGCNCSVSCNF